jgi:hypothetical protein
MPEMETNAASGSKSHHSKRPRKLPENTIRRSFLLTVSAISHVRGGRSMNRLPKILAVQILL